MILRDSEATIRAALDSARGLYDELVVVMDSRSTDATERIVREEYGAKVETRDWLGFAEMRNESLRIARNKWCLILDGDEEIIDRGNIVDALAVAEEKGIDAVFVTIRSESKDHERFEVDRQMRFIDRSRVRYRFAVHNQPRGYRENRLGISDLVIRADYTGDMTSRVTRSEPPLLDMLKMSALGSEEWTHARFFLCRLYGMVNRYDEAIEHARALLDVRPADLGFCGAWLVLIRCVLARDGPEKGLAVILECVRHHPKGFADPWWWLMRVSVFNCAKSWQEPGPYILSPQVSHQYLDKFPEAGTLLGFQFRTVEAAA